MRLACVGARYTTFAAIAILLIIRARILLRSVRLRTERVRSVPNETFRDLRGEIFLCSLRVALPRQVVFKLRLEALALSCRLCYIPRRLKLLL